MLKFNTDGSLKDDGTPLPGLTEKETKEYKTLRRLRNDYTRYFSQTEFDRFKELAKKIHENAGDPTKLYVPLIGMN